MLYLAWILTLNYSLANFWTSHLLIRRAPLWAHSPTISGICSPKRWQNSQERTLIPPQLPFGDCGPWTCLTGYGGMCCYSCSSRSARGKPFFLSVCLPVLWSYLRSDVHTSSVWAGSTPGLQENRTPDSTQEFSPLHIISGSDLTDTGITAL